MRHEKPGCQSWSVLFHYQKIEVCSPAHFWPAAAGQPKGMAAVVVVMVVVVVTKGEKQGMACAYIYLSKFRPVPRSRMPCGEPTAQPSVK